MNGQAATHYSVLGLTPEATLGEIKAAYRERIEALRQRLNTPERPDEAQLDALRQAIATLGDPQARAAYDAQQALLATVAQAASNVPPVLPPGLPPLPSLPAVAAADAGQGREEKFSFEGEGGEYFRIWIVNLLLSILTLGIYSAWAKVRREQYFHRNLLLDGSGFDYHGQPIPILKGRIVAVLLLIALSLAEKAGPAAYGIALLALVPVVPWLAVKAFRFRAHNTSYRGLRFSFHATYGQAAKVFIGYGLLTLLTMWLAFPLFYRQLRKFVLDNTRFGTTSLTCAVGIGEIYRIFLRSALLILLAGVLALLVGILFAATGNGENRAIGTILVAAALIPLLYLMVLTVLFPYIQARTINAVWGSTTLGAHAFVSRLPVGGYIRLTLANWLAILFTLGLFIPWARVRVARFRAEHLALAVAGNLDDFVAAEASAATAVGDEAAEMFDLDIGL